MWNLLCNIYKYFLFYIIFQCIWFGESGYILDLESGRNGLNFYGSFLYCLHDPCGIYLDYYLVPLKRKIDYKGLLLFIILFFLMFLCTQFQIIL